MAALTRSSTVPFFWALIVGIKLGVAGCSDPDEPHESVDAARVTQAEIVDTTQHDRAAVGHCHTAAHAAPLSPIADAYADQFRSDGTRRMADRLTAIDASSDPRLNMFDSARRVAMLQRAQATVPTLNGQFQLGLEYLRNGQTEQAIKQFELTRAAYRQRPEDFQSNTVETLYELFGLTYLRLGEIENCVNRHSADSCLVPIVGKGVHTVKRGSRKAAEIFREALTQYPNSLKFRWLLNIAYMTLGEWPEAVEPKWRIGPDAFASDCEFPRFYDRATHLGVDVVSMLGGSITEDFDADGDIDLVASAWGLRDQIRYFRNNGNGTFDDHTVESGLIGITGGINIIHADYDNDGFADVLILRGGWIERNGHYPNSLLRNRGDGSFDDVTEQAGLLSMHPTQTATWADFDRDGWLDLFVGNETWPNDGRHLCELFRNNGDGTFTESAKPCGVDLIGIVKGVTSGDFDNDGWPDLYVSCFNQENVLYRNLGPPTSGSSWLQFADVAAEAGVQEPVRSFPTWFWDYDNDGWLDLFVGGFWVSDVGEVAAGYIGVETPGERPRLYRNRGDGTFEDTTKAAGLDIVTMPMGANYGDLDNDGWQDFYLGTGNPSVKMTIPNLVFRGEGGQLFLDVTSNGGFGHLQKGHGVSFADIDGDGDQDLFTVLGGAFGGDVAFNALYENPGNDNHWITMRFIGSTSNRGAVGARVKVEVETPSGPRAVHTLVSTGGSFGSSSLQQEIGLGDATRITGVEIRWPAVDSVQRFDEVPLDRAIEVREGQADWSPVEVRKFSLSGRVSAD